MSINQILINDSESNHIKKIGFLHLKNADSFIGNIVENIEGKTEFIVRKVEVNSTKDIDDMMEWADICWFEWCDSLIVYGSNHPLASKKKIICRVHSYEAFTDFPKQVNWDNVDKVIFVANHIKNKVLSEVKIEENKINIIPNGIDIESLGFNERTKGFNIAYVGYIDYKKGPMLLIHSFNAIHNYDNRYKLYIAGKFTDERYILYFNKIVKELNLQDSVFFQGWQKDLNQWLEDKNYIICTSVLESQNVSIMQGMAKGIKPLIHNFVGAEEIYEKKFIWTSIDELVMLIKEKEYNSNEYRNEITTRFSIENQMNKINKLIEEIKSDKKIYDLKEKKQPMVTIGIPNYNYANFLKECVCSILNQSYKNVEILIIDDCSVDNSVQVIKELKQQDCRVKAIFHENNSGSIIKAFNETIEIGQGEYFTIISADDYLANPQVLEKYMKFALENKDIDQIYGNILTVDHEGNKTEQWKYKDYSDNEVIKNTFLMKGSGVIPYTCSLFKRNFFVKNNVRWNEYKGNILGLDTLNTLVNIKNNCKRKYLDETLMCYRQHGSNMTYNFKNRVISIISILEYIIENFNESIYFDNVNWNELSVEDRDTFKFYILGIIYYNIMSDYVNGINMPWSNKITFDSEQKIEYIQPFLDVIEKYFNKSLLNSNKYETEINNLKTNIQNLRTTKQVMKIKEEDILQKEICEEGKKRRQLELVEFNGKYAKNNIGILILSPSNGYWKYAFSNWRYVLQYMGFKVDIVIDLDDNPLNKNYDILISIADENSLRKVMKNKSVLEIENKIGIGSKSNNDIINIQNIEMCNRIKFNFIISSFCEEAINENWKMWIDEKIRMLSVPFGFNPLIHYPENQDKIYNYFFVGTNSPIKIQETKDYLLAVASKYEGIIRGVGWGKNIPDLTESNVGYFYNRSKINLNYHLEIQKEQLNEINERTFIIGACGGFQLCDSPKAMSKYYTEKDIAIAKNPKDYLEKYEYYINNPLDRYEISYNALISTYEGKNSLFYRMEKILKNLGCI